MSCKGICIRYRASNNYANGVVIQIASSIWKTGSKDIRDVLKISKLCNPMDSEEDINGLISIHKKYRKIGREYN